MTRTCLKTGSRASLVDMRHVKFRFYFSCSLSEFTNMFLLVSFAGLGYLAFYLAGKMHLFDEGGVC